MFKRKTAGEFSSHTAVLVGHCGFDSGGLTRLLQDTFPGIDVAAARSLDALETYADAGALLLINRLPEGAFNNRDGVALIRHLAQRPNALPARAVLVSNYADAQADAVAAGASPGFGKSEMHTEQTKARLRHAHSADA